MLDYIAEINNLITELKKYDDAYNEGKPLISDTEYDNLYFKLMKLEKEHEFYLPSSPTQCINYKVVNGLNKKVHKYPMLSLDKTKDWNEFVRYFNYHEVTGMIKLDGLTCCLEYQDGRLVGAETRGNGAEGEDILHNALVVSNIPNRINYTGSLILNGEIISTYSNFENFETEYANPRNFAAGSIRLLDSKECAKRGLMFVAWEVKEGGTESHIDDLNMLADLADAAAYFGAELYSAEALPMAFSGRNNTIDLIFGLKNANLCGFFTYLALEYPQTATVGIYTKLISGAKNDYFRN